MFRRFYRYSLTVFIPAILFFASGCQTSETKTNLPHSSPAHGPFQPKTVPSSENAFHQSFYAESISRLNQATQGTPYVELPLTEVIKLTKNAESEREVYKYAADAWSHEFFWKSIATNGGGKPSGALLRKIEDSFGSFDHFKSDFLKAVNELEGNGWVWVVLENDTVKILSTSNYDIPAEAMPTLLVLDVWEHAYITEFGNDRQAYAENFLDHLANWTFAEKNLTSF